MKRALPVLLTLAAIAVLAATLVRVQRYDPGRAGLMKDASGLGDVSIRFERSRLISRCAGIPEWALTAERVDFRHAPGGPIESYRAVEFNGISQGELYRQGRVEAAFAARSAVFDRSPQHLDVSGRIRVRTPDGDTLTSEALTWSVQDEFARFPAGAQGKVQGHAIAAPVLLFAPQKRLIQCPSGASVLLPGGPLTTDALFWDIARRTVRCPGTARWVRKSGEITGQDALLELKTRTIRVKKATVRMPIDEIARPAEVHP